MTRTEFDTALATGIFPPDENVLLHALFHDARGDWEAAHDIAQSREGTPLYDHLHAYLHRKEGDTWNANYWYIRAKTTMPNLTLQQEWARLVELFSN